VGSWRVDPHSPIPALPYPEAWRSAPVQERMGERGDPTVLDSDSAGLTERRSERSTRDRPFAYAAGVLSRRARCQNNEGDGG